MFFMIRAIRSAVLVILSTAALTFVVSVRPVSAAQTSVNVIDSSFSPSTISVNAGDTVVWTNHGSMQHTVTGDNGSFDSGTLMPGQTYSHTFSAPGTYRYYCRFHGGPGGVGMSGTIVVGSGSTMMPYQNSNMNYNYNYNYNGYNPSYSYTPSMNGNYNYNYNYNGNNGYGYSLSWCGTYYSYNGCPTYSYMNYSPYYSSYYYPTMYGNAYAYASAYASAAYPSYSMSYPMMYGNSYNNSYGSAQYCYSGYGCYPYAVQDPHQWVYDYWTGSWY